MIHIKPKICPTRPGTNHLSQITTSSLNFSISATSTKSNKRNLTSKEQREREREREGLTEMAANSSLAASSTVVGLGTSTLSRSSSKSSSLSSGFLRSKVAARNPLRLACAGASGGRFTCFERNWLRTDFNVIGFGLIGWIAPSSIPAINGNSLTGLFFSSIGQELSHFPTGPALTSQFWLWLVLWHLGLFLCLTFGQIGFKGRTDGYF